MESKEARKKAIKAYKEAETVGGIYRLINPAHDWVGPLSATPNLKGMQSKMQFAQKTRTCFENSLRKTWEAYNGEGFEIVILEELEKKPEHTTQEFREDLGELLLLWQEKEAERT